MLNIEGVAKYNCLIFEVYVGTWRAMSAFWQGLD